MCVCMYVCFMVSRPRQHTRVGVLSPHMTHVNAQVELTNPFNDALDVDGDEADRRSSGDKIGDLPSLRETLRESLRSEAGAVKGQLSREAFAPLEFGQGDGRGLGTATAMVLSVLHRVCVCVCVCVRARARSLCARLCTCAYESAARSL